MDRTLRGGVYGLLDDVALTHNVEFVEGPAGHWVYRDGLLRNAQSDFFRVGGYRDAGGAEHVLLEQSEFALVGLVVSRSSGRLRYLLNVRAEPGLHGGAQFSTTIQSTPSNYERRHGGGSTPFIAELLDPPAGARVLHDSLQYDWWQYYRRKAKRFRILELADEPEVELPLVWVEAEDMRNITRRDYTATGDLRVAAYIADLVVDDPTIAMDISPTEPIGAKLESIPLADLTGWRVTPQGVMSVDGERDVLWVSTRSTTREVHSWIQPLMKLRDPLEARLASRARNGTLEFAIQRVSPAQLEGSSVWMPAEPNAIGATLASRKLSAEGGRFYQHPIHLHVVEGLEVPDGSRWLDLDSFRHLALSSLETSLELRLLFALAGELREGAR